MIEPLFDSHAHYDDTKFDQDREQLLSSLESRGVRMVMNAASSLDSARQCIQLAERHPHVYCSVGIHPHAAKDATEELEEILEQMARHQKVKAIGEMGLDYHYDFSPRPVQLEVFERQIVLAQKLDLPVIVHDREAHGDTMTLLRRHRPRGVVHCYSGSVQMARELVELGFYLGFTGVVTFKNARRALEVVRAVPLERILIETDCPYMAPEPYRGQRCDSTMLDRVVSAIAEARGEDASTICAASYANACRLYAIGY